MEFILSYFGANEKGEEMELGGRIATASVRTGFAMTGFLQGVRWLVGDGAYGCHPTRIYVGQGPCALPGNVMIDGRRGEGTPPYGGKREAGETGRRGRRPLRTI